MRARLNSKDWGVRDKGVEVESRSGSGKVSKWRKQLYARGGGKKEEVLGQSKRAGKICEWRKGG